MTNRNSKTYIFQSYLILTIFFLLPVYLIKIKYGWISFNLLEALIGTLFLVWILNREKIPKLLIANYKLPAILIFSGLLLSVFANKNYYAGLGSIKGWFIFPIIFSIVFFDALKKNEGLLKKSFFALFLSGAAVSAVGVVYRLFGMLTYDGRLKIFWDSPNQLAMFLAPAFLIGVIKFNFEESRAFAKVREGKVELWKMGIIIAGTLCIAFNLYFTKSYGAWIAVLAVTSIIFWLEYAKKLRRKYLVSVIIIFVIIAGLVSSGKFKEIQNLGERSSLESRIMIWKSAGLMIKSNPLFGIGPGNFQEKYLEYQKYFPPYLEWAAPQPHNIYLAFWLEAGLIGLVGFAWLVIVFFRENKKAREIDSDASLICLAIILYFLLHGLVDTTYWRNDMAVMFWAIIVANIGLAGKKSV